MSYAMHLLPAIAVVFAIAIAAFVVTHPLVQIPVTEADTYQTFVMKCSMRTGECKVDR